MFSTHINYDSCNLYEFKVVNYSPLWSYNNLLRKVSLLAKKIPGDSGEIYLAKY